jgi:hypothetical protein
VCFKHYHSIVSVGCKIIFAHKMKFDLQQTIYAALILI